MATVQSTVTNRRGLAGLRFVLTVTIYWSWGLADGSCDSTCSGSGLGLRIGLYQM